ncbi:hypothetical protein JMA_10080 [Jeotgalibacillus malaysiensis]|uniref:Uncharacterized protein n=1 Tax=Jeotgalibacillus malaysiensis TaxID=1508404 RepID=A0A0B5AJ21_9BACL|nr:hypothetical protein [Jeotgalibacillus malaysiensis]AJD90325.1 hypothetical protein JMA_10080 [Jeotgalibacillus malaysiensis]
MSKSKAKKQRLHAVRNGRFDVEMKRGTQTEISTHVRKTKTKKEKLDQVRNKHKKSTSGWRVEKVA